MLDRSIMERIIFSGVHAPSGDNTQPWSFRIDGPAIIVYAHPELDHPILNVDDRGTLLATGALIENMVIAARQEGLHASVQLFEREGETARLVLSYEGDTGHELFEAIRMRHTHRGEYHEDLDADALRALAVEPEPHCTLRLITDRKSIREIADSAVAMEESALTTKKLHFHFFRSILWSASDNDRGRSGLFIKTTELPPPVQALFRLIRHWPIMRVFQHLGLPALAAKQNAAVYSASGAIAVISVDRTEPRDFISAGRTMQRLWLAAAKRGLGAQPLAGLIYLAEYVARTDDPDIEPDLKKKIFTAQASMHRISGVKQDTIAMMLRIGTPRKGASARARRRPAKIL